MTYPDPGDLFISDLNPIPDPTTEVQANIPGSPGGLLEAVKRAVVTSVRAAINETTISSKGNIYVDIEYPMKEEQYPGIWVNFSIQKLVPAGLGQEEIVRNEAGDWAPVRQWMFNGRITLDIVALTARDRDRLADAMIMMIAFARPPDLGVIYKPGADTKQDKSLMTTLNNNPYVAMTLFNGQIIPGGQQAQQGGLPWQQNVMVYEDSYGCDVVGNFSTRYDHDGAFVISAFKTDATPAATGVAYDPNQNSSPTFAVGADPRGRYYPPPPSPYEYQ